MYKILVGGDLFIDQPYTKDNIDSSVIELFDQVNLRIINLEAPVTDSNYKILKTGPNLKINKGGLTEVIKALKIDMVTLANNHILDYGENGLSDTLAYAQENNIDTVGAGKNLHDAIKISHIVSDEGSISIVNFTEKEWTGATPNSAGANPMDLVDNIQQIKQAKEIADLVIVIVHGGNEYNHYPSPRMVKQYRFYAENGADIVIGHHTHCISGYEKYNGVPIFYSLGNFLFTTKLNKKDSWYIGLLIEFTIQDRNKVTFELVPVVQTRDSHGLRLALDSERKEILQQIGEINKVIADEDQLRDKWADYVKKVKPGYLKWITPIGGIKNRYLKALIYRSGLYNYFLPQSYIKEHYNRIRCEAHHDVALEVFKQMLNKVR